MSTLKFDPETVVADRFCLKRPLSSGAMGTIWLAHHTRLDVPCAVKFIDSGEASMEELERRFEREAKAAALLRCANVVTILDFGVFEDRAYLAMEYLEGETLESRLERRGQLSPSETVAILAQVGRALAKAHAAGLVHRDLKPANIFLVADDDREIVKVLDFGIVKMPTDTNKTTQVGALLGTPNYMSPEQARGLAGVDHRSDLWSLAVLAYECITGQLPFEGKGLGELISKIVLGPIPLPSSVARVPASFDHWWAKAAAREPRDRFSNAMEQVKALAASFELPRSSLLPRKLSAAPAPVIPSIRPQCEAETVAARFKVVAPVLEPALAESVRDQSAPGILLEIDPVTPPKPRRRLFAVASLAVGLALGVIIVRGRAPAEAAAAARPVAAPLVASVAPVAVKPPPAPSPPAAVADAPEPAASDFAEAPPAETAAPRPTRRGVRPASKVGKKSDARALTGAPPAPAKPVSTTWTPIGLR